VDERVRFHVRRTVLKHDRHMRSGSRTYCGRVVEVGRTGARFGSARNRQRWTDVDQDVEQDEQPGELEHEPAVEVGRTGARFGSARARHRWQDERPADRVEEPPRTETLPVWPRPVVPALPPLDDDHLAEDEEPSALVRPYARTGGRTEGSRELRLETLLSVSRTDLVLMLEHSRIVEICEATSSVAEVAAALAAPLGVARVLLSDLIEMGVLSVHTGDNQPAQELMARVLAGLRRL
jgi:Protein of unknown function (DUF742)